MSETRNQGWNRWYLDGWRARTNGRPRSANPRVKFCPIARDVILANPANPDIESYMVPTHKWRKWDEGWVDADDAIKGMKFAADEYEENIRAEEIMERLNESR